MGKLLETTKLGTTSVDNRANSQLTRSLEERSEYRRFLEGEIANLEIRTAILSLKK